MHKRLLPFLFIIFCVAAIGVTLTDGLVAARSHGSRPAQSTASGGMAARPTPAMPDAFSDPINCTTASSPVVGFEVSQNQLTGDVDPFLTNLEDSGYTVGTVDISSGSVPACVDVLIVLGMSGNNRLPASYTTAQANLLQDWVAAGHGLMANGEWGDLRMETQPIFQAFGYTMEASGPGYVTDPTNNDPDYPQGDSWIIYSAPHFSNHPTLSGLNSLELLTGSWLSPDSGAIVTTDGDASPANTSVMAAADHGSGCALFTADSSWLAVYDDGYNRQENRAAAQNAVDWLLTCSDLTLLKTADPDPVGSGQTLTYTMTATNYDGSSMTQVVISDTVPAGATFVSASPTHSGPDAKNAVTWSLGAVAAGDSATAQMVVQLDNGWNDGETVINTAEATSDQSQESVRATAVTTIQNQSVSLTADAGGPYQVNEGSSVVLDGAGSTHSQEGDLTYRWDLDNDGQYNDATGSSPTFSAANRDDGVYAIGLAVTDGSATDNASSTVTVNNVPPAPGIAAATWNVLVNTPVTFSGSVNDPGVLDTHQIDWDFGDGGTAVADLTANHTYTTPGQYTVSLTVADDDEGTGTAVRQIEVVSIDHYLFLPVTMKNYCHQILVGADVVLAIDTSGSMEDLTEPNGPTKLAAAQSAVSNFLDLLNFPDDQAAIHSFASTATVRHSLSSDKNALNASLQSLVADGSTRIDLALAQARGELTGSGHDLQNLPVLILLTDGHPTETTVTAILNEAQTTKAAGIIIYTIGLGTSVNAGLLRDIATTPDHYYFSPSTSALDDIYVQIAAQIQCSNQ